MISKYRTKQVSAFTTYGHGYLRALVNEVWVSEAFDHTIQSIKLKPEETQQYKALWDTGATHTCITHKIVEDLDLRPSGKTILAGANSQKEVFTYFIALGLPNKVVFSAIRVALVENITDADILIGMDVIRYGDLAISNSNNRTIFSFRVPPIEEIDFRNEIDQDMRKAPPRTPDGLRRKRNRKKKEKQTKKGSKKHR